MASTAPGSATPVAAATSTPSSEPTFLGVRRASLVEGGLSSPTLSTGPNAVVALSQDATTVYSTTGANSYLLESSLGPDQTAKHRLVAVEQHPDEPSLVVDIVLADSAGSGLKASKVVVSATFWTDEGRGETVEVPVEHQDAELTAVTVSNGVVCISLAYSDTVKGEDVDVVCRTAFTSEGKVLWSRTDPNNTNMGFYANDPVLPTMTSGDLTTNRAHQFIFGVDDRIVAVDPETGKNAWTAKGQYSNGLAMATADIFALEAYSQGGYGDGYALFDASTGKRLESSPIRSLALDPIAGTVAMAFTTTDNDMANEANNDGASPALRVVEVPSGTEVFTLPRSAAQDLGQVDVVAAFDGRLILRVKDGIRVVTATTGEPEPGFESVPPGTFRLHQVPQLSAAGWAALGETNGFGETDSKFISSLVYSDSDLAWDDLGVDLEPAAPDGAE